MFHTNDIAAILAEEAQEAAQQPEGMSLYVLTDDETTARAVAPMMARTLYPEMRFGEVLHAEATAYEGSAFEVVLRVHP